jgi:hypothetical protein
MLYDVRILFGVGFSSSVGIAKEHIRIRTTDLFDAIFKHSRNLLILKASVAPEGPHKTSRNRLLLPYCSQKTLIAPARQALCSKHISESETDPLNGSGRRFRPFEWR